MSKDSVRLLRSRNVEASPLNAEKFMNKTPAAALKPIEKNESPAAVSSNIVQGQRNAEPILHIQKKKNSVTVGDDINTNEMVTAKVAASSSSKKSSTVNEKKSKLTK